MLNMILTFQRFEPEINIVEEIYAMINFELLPANTNFNISFSYGFYLIYNFQHVSL